MEPCKLVINGRRPSDKEAVVPAIWLLVLPDWEIHDGPEVFRSRSYEDEDGILIWLTDEGGYELLADGSEQPKERWIGLTRLGDVALMPVEADAPCESH